MKATEHQTQPDSTYINYQDQIDEKIRSLIVDWLVSVHSHPRFNLLPETLYLTVNLIDRYMSLFQVSKKETQLIAVAALLIATKYEEIYPPTVKDFILLTDKVFDRADILNMEFKILHAVDFELSQTSSYRFLERYFKFARTENKAVFFMAQYLLELAMLDSKMNMYPPSLLASAAIYVGLRVISNEQ